MDNEERFVTGLDLGTETTRAVIVAVNKKGEKAVVGYNAGPSAGMRKGAPADLAAPAGAIDQMLGEAERMANFEVRSAYVSLNGAGVGSVWTEGMIMFSSPDHEVTEEDLLRIEETALSNCVLTNREILAMIPLEYALDGQRGIKNPLMMVGAKLEMRALVVSALKQTCENLKRITASADVQALRLVPSVTAAARAVLTGRQMENGVAVVEMGAATTSVAVYKEGDLQYLAVVPVGSNNITDDLAVMLKIDPGLGEEIKLNHISGDFEVERHPVIRISDGREERVFERKEVEELVQFRLEEIFTKIREKLKKAGYDRRLPEGIILTGGGAKMPEIEVFAREVLEAAVKIGVPQGLGGAIESIQRPEFAVATGLALLAAEERPTTQVRAPKPKKAPKNASEGNLLKKIFGKF